MSKIVFSLLIISITTFSNVMADVSPETVVDIFQRLEKLEKKTRVLQGKNEELQHQITQLKKQQKQGFLAIDERIDQIKPAENKETEIDEEEPKVRIIDTNPETTNNDEKEESKPPEKVVTSTVDEPKKGGEGKEVKQASTSKIEKAPTAYEKETYQAAFNLMKKSPSAATTAFKEYIKMQPKSPLAANSQYWIGEIMYSHNNYKGAVQEFIKVLQNYKYSSKAPDAAIKLGYSFYALKNWEYARRTFEDVLKYFPKNENAVNLAKKRLEKMKAAGH